MGKDSCGRIDNFAELAQGESRRLVQALRQRRQATMDKHEELKRDIARAEDALQQNSYEFRRCNMQKILVILTSWRNHLAYWWIRAELRRQRNDVKQLWKELRPSDCAEAVKALDECDAALDLYAAKCAGLSPPMTIEERLESFATAADAADAALVKARTKVEKS